MGTLLLNSRGFNTRAGTSMIYGKLKELGYADLSSKKIFAVSCPEYEVDEIVKKNLIEIMGFKLEHIYMSGDGIPDGTVPDIIYVTEGNTFEVLEYHGMSIYAFRDGNGIMIKQNNRYSHLPSPRYATVRENEELGIKWGCPVYQSFKTEPDAFSFLENPDEYVEKIMNSLEFHDEFVKP